MTPKLFTELGLSPEVLKAIDRLGFEQAAPIQAEAIPLMMQGCDVVGQSQTGSGKTAAFAIPAIEKTDPHQRAVQVLILCPTRELAVQVSEEVHKLAWFKRGIQALPIYGGQSYERQFHGLRQGAQIVIGTPGRVMDHMRRGTLRLDTVRLVVLDEADVMLDMGFREDIEFVLQAVPAGRQTVFFCATLPGPIQDLIGKYARDPRNARIEQKTVTVPTVEQVYYEIDRRFKIELLTRLIDLHDLKLGIIFCNTKRMVDELVEHLEAQGYSADRLHGDMSQALRDRVMNKFRKSGLEFLVATDVAARGIDVDDVQVVFNYDLPYDVEDYVHRIGRTGRAGRSGRAITFVAGREVFQIRNIERYTNTRIHRARVPTPDEVEEARSGQVLDKLRATLQAGEFRRQEPLVERLLEEGFSSTDIAAALLHQLQASEPPRPARPPREPAHRRAPVLPPPAPRRPTGAHPARAYPKAHPAPPPANRPVVPPQPSTPPAPFAPPALAAAPSTAVPAVAAPPVPAEPSATPPVLAPPPTPLPLPTTPTIPPPPTPPTPTPPRVRPSPPKPRPALPAAPRTPARAPARTETRPGPLRRPGNLPKPSRRTPAHQTRLHVNAGSAMEVTPGDIVRTILGETGLPADVVGVVDIRERHLFVDVASDHARAILARLNRAYLKGQRLKARVASSHPDARRPGFTLIEVLVVIAIVGVLAAMLLPALSRAQARAKQTNCLSNARQLALGVMLYADEHNDTFPPSADYSLDPSDPSRVWTTKVLPYVESTAVFSCPSVPGRAYPANWAERGVGSIGYTTATAYDPAETEGFATCTRASAIESPSLAPLFGDTPGGPTSDKYRGFTFDPYNGQANPRDPRLGAPLIGDRDLVKELNHLPPAALKPLFARHHGLVILILADGHAGAYSTRAVLAQDRGAGLHWRFRPGRSPSPRLSSRSTERMNAV